MDSEVVLTYFSVCLIICMYVCVYMHMCVCIHTYIITYKAILQTEHLSRRRKQSASSPVSAIQQGFRSACTITHVCNH